MSNKGKWPARNFSERYHQDGHNDFVTFADLGAGGVQSASSHGLSALGRECVPGCATPSGRPARLDPPTNSEVQIPTSGDILEGNQWNEPSFHIALNDSKPLIPQRSISPYSYVPQRLRQDISEANLSCDDDSSIKGSIPYHENIPSEELCIIEGESIPTRARCTLFQNDSSEWGYPKNDTFLLNNFEEVEQLIQEEGEDVTMALHLQNRWATSQTQEQVVHDKCQSQQDSRYQPDEYEESDEEVSPEVAAAMMHSEEQGILMGAAPMRVYNALFSDDEKDLIAVTSAAPFHPQNVVVPASVDNLPYTTSAEDLVALASSIQGKDPLPSNSLFADHVKERGLYNSVMAEASKPYVAESTNAAGSSEDVSKSSLPSVSGGSIEYVLDPASPPDHYSRVQLRGSTSPDWFPGYFQALPNIDGITAVCRDASTVVEDAWSTLQSTMA